jgi:hypothetical protein
LRQVERYLTTSKRFLPGSVTGENGPHRQLGRRWGLPSSPHQSTTRGPVVGGRTYADPMVDHAETLSKAEAAGVLRRVGFSDEKIDKLLSELNDPIDFDRDAAILEKFGVNRDTLVDLMGGSP